MLIIGSGAAGGVLAATLAEATNLRIVLLERGGWFGASFFDQNEWNMRVLYAEEGRRSTVDGAIPVRGGECVGGGTTVNYALCFDPIESVWNGWRSTHGLTGFSFDPDASDYGIAGLNLASALQEVRTRLNVHLPADEEVNDNNRVLQRGCEALGLESRKFELNMRGCVGSGFCGEGCSYDAKLGTLITYVPDATARGVQLVHHCTVDRLTFEKRRGALTAVGATARIRPTRPGSLANTVAPGRLEIDARLVILAAGAIATPSLLQRSGHPDPHRRLGRGLVIHPSLPVMGVMEQEITNYRGIPGTVYSPAFYRRHGFYLEGLFGHPVYGSLVLPGIGSRHFEALRLLPRLAGFGVMLVDEVDDANRVTHDRVDGKPIIHYQLAAPDQERLRFAAARAVEVMLAGGAKEVMLPTDGPLGPLPSAVFRDPAEAVHCAALALEPHRTVITSSHAQATAKMGENRELTVTNSRGESHEVRNLIVCDSSTFPTSCGSNPMLSILAMARYQGRRLAAELSRHDL